MICKTCKKELEEDANFCITCGAKNETLVTEKPAGLMKDGLFVTGLFFLIQYLLSLSFQTFVDEWYNFHTVTNIQHLIHVSLPLVLAYYAKGQAKTYLFIFGAFLIALNLFFNFIS